MGFFKRDKDKNEKPEENNQLKPDASGKKTPLLVEMTIDSIRVGQNVKSGSGTLHPVEPYQRVLILKEIKGNRYLPIWVDHHGAESISANLQLQYIAFKDLPRPMTHDFLCAIIRALGARVENVVVSELKNDCFYAITCLDCDGKSIKVDCRPSDAIAVAVRTGTPIFATEEVLKKASVTVV